jgi:hypothetical protein
MRQAIGLKARPIQHGLVLQDKIVPRFALTIYPYSLGSQLHIPKEFQA